MRGPLTKSELDAVAEGSLRYTGDLGLKHATENLPYLKNTVFDLPRAKPSDWAIVVSAGPSLHTRDPAKAILAAGFDGAIIAVDVALRYCLRSGLIPDYVVCVDPHEELVIRYFGDPELPLRAKTDYFQRTELDPVVASGEVSRNIELIKLVNRYGPSMKAVIATSVAPNVTRRVLEAGMEIYWWNPLYDDWEVPNSYTRRVWEVNHVPCMVGGGNVGTASWVFAHSVLRKTQVGLVGMDFGYPPGTPVFNTQRYYELRDFFGEANAGQGLIPIVSHYLGETWLTDPTYDWYRQTFLEMAKLAECQTYNCTEGGVLFGEPITWMPLQEFLDHWGAHRPSNQRRGGHGEDALH